MLSNCSSEQLSDVEQANIEPSESSQIQKYNPEPLKSGKSSETVWEKVENQLLIEVMRDHSEKSWNEISQLFNKLNIRKRKAKDISQHWNRVICIEHIKWTDAEDLALIQAVQVCKPHDWKAIKLRLQYRNNNEIIARLKVLQKKGKYQLERQYWP